jgi:DnaJ-class molecular chaperone
VNLKKCLPPIFLDMKLNARSDTFAIQDNCSSHQKISEIIPCKICRGTGKVLSGNGAICMEPVENVEKCPNCCGKGYL